MKRGIIIFSIALILVLTVGVFAETALISETNPNIKDFVTDFAGKKGVENKDINNITEVDFNSLPKEVNIENVDDTNLAIYQVNYNDTASDTGQKNLYVITYSTEKLQSQGDLIIASDKREFLNFGLSETSGTSRFLKTATGIQGSLEVGYVMMRDGSITGISTMLDIVNASDSGSLEIIIYKNGEAVRFGNTLDSSSVGIKKDNDIQSNDVITFNKGDIISAYIRSDGSSWKDVITLVEITTK